MGSTTLSICVSVCVDCVVQFLWASDFSALPLWGTVILSAGFINARESMAKGTNPRPTFAAVSVSAFSALLAFLSVFFLPASDFAFAFGAGEAGSP